MRDARPSDGRRCAAFADAVLDVNTMVMERPVFVAFDA